VEATLERVWERTHWPSDETIEGLWDLHRLKKEQVIEWFANKRRLARSEGSKTQKAGKKSAASVRDGQEDTDRVLEKDGTSLTVWDSEWNAASADDG
jgi:hypothetical protein